MGLCKCTKKKVTNLFCFEHKVNVCEHCLVEDHEKCIVKSYLQWLEDSDYNAACSICDKPLRFEDMDCIRLVCYDVFHLKCLNEMANRLPETTAPAGYECPMCKKPIIPYPNQGGPLVENLRNKICKSPWFLRTLRLKSGEEIDGENFEFIEESQAMQEQKLNGTQSKEIVNSIDHPTQAHIKKVQKINNNKVVKDNQNEDHKEHSVYQMPDMEQSPNIRKAFLTNRGADLSTTVVRTNNNKNDEENKYSRKSLCTHIATLIKAHFPLSTSRRSPQKAYHYFILTLVIGIILFIILLWLFSVLGRYSADQDPMLDPRFNPNLEFVKEHKSIGSLKDDRDGHIVRGGGGGAINNIEAPSHR